MRFVLSIDLGNDAMRTADDVAATLEQVALNVTRAYADEPPPFPLSPRIPAYAIIDTNGNRVGSWSVTT